ncbi:hypothetical protein [Bacillus cereus group sp. Bce001]|uniref:hypothetical protein n=1 Tax=Bacillus cereus group sp. Bce001 TaxID=3445260 RepID=UPI003F26A804
MERFTERSETVMLPLSVTVHKTNTLHTKRTLFLCSTAYFTDRFMLYYKTKTTQIGHSLNEYRYNAFQKRKVFYKTNEHYLLIYSYKNRS